MNQDVERVNQILRSGEPQNISIDDYSGFTGYKPQAVIDAMNEALWGCWGFEEVSSEVIEQQNGLLAVCQVRVFLIGEDGTYNEFKPVAWGQGRSKSEYGDVRKAAQTDAIKKALSYFSIGNRAYHGLLPGGKQSVHTQPQETNGTVKNTLHNSEPSPNQLKEIARLANELNIQVKRPATYKEASELHTELARQYNAREVHPA